MPDSVHELTSLPRMLLFFPRKPQKLFRQRLSMLRSSNLCRFCCRSQDILKCVPSTTHFFKRCLGITQVVNRGLGTQIVAGNVATMHTILFEMHSVNRITRDACLHFRPRSSISASSLKFTALQEMELQRQLLHIGLASFPAMEADFQGRRPAIQNHENGSRKVEIFETYTN